MGAVPKVILDTTSRERVAQLYKAKSGRCDVCYLPIEDEAQATDVLPMQGPRHGQALLVHRAGCASEAVLACIPVRRWRR